MVDLQLNQETPEAKDHEAGANGLFGADRPIRAVGGEALPLLGGGRALLMQLAHPLVAEGVAQFSSFSSDPFHRLFRTLEFVDTLIFGSQIEIDRTLVRFHNVHRAIEGRLRQPAGQYPSGAPFRGDDPALSLWVFATLVDSSLIGYEHFVAPLPMDRKDAYYSDARLVAETLGLPHAILPRNLPALHNYMNDMLTGDGLAVTETSRRLAAEILRPRAGARERLGAALLRLTTPGLLPIRLRAAYRLPWSGLQDRLLWGLGGFTRLARPVTPDWLWRSPLRGPGLARRLLWPA